METLPSLVDNSRAKFILISKIIPEHLEFILEFTDLYCVYDYVLVIPPNEIVRFDQEEILIHQYDDSNILIFYEKN